uniref:MICOS complex subunit MIC60 n=1 Tax=Glossina pallidipes TaxID=7398 RepID=A0A1A9ZGC1_GLOPL
MLKESELKRHYTRKLEDKMATEKANYKLQLAAMLGKIRGMNAVMQALSVCYAIARAEGEQSSHQAQALWAAYQALWCLVRTGEPGTHWKTKLCPLRNEIKAIKIVADPISKAELQNTKFDYSSTTSVDWDIARIEQCHPLTAIHLHKCHINNNTAPILLTTIASTGNNIHSGNHNSNNCTDKNTSSYSNSNVISAISTNKQHSLRNDS